MRSVKVADSPLTGDAKAKSRSYPAKRIQNIRVLEENIFNRKDLNQMTNATNTRQLRLLVSGVLQLHGIDNLQCELRIVEAVKKFLAEGNAEPVHTKERILADVAKQLGKSAVVGTVKQAIYDEINKRVGIRPTGNDWEDFITFCSQEHDKGKTISEFLDWWLSDEWQAEHPPSRPQIWRVKWDLAFRAGISQSKDSDDLVV
jgi:hypothetical protein